jgi:hypothetical protein
MGTEEGRHDAVADEQAPAEPLAENESAETGAAEAPANVLTKEELRARHRGMYEATEVVHGCRIGPISWADSVRLKMERGLASDRTKGDALAKTIAMQLKEQACYLAYGVREPKLTVAEWEEELSCSKAGELDEVVQRIQEISGIESLEMMVTKKVFDSMAGASQNSTLA